MCVVVRGTPVRGVIWADPSRAWDVSGDFRLYAVGVAADGSHYMVAAMMCEAMETRYQTASGSGTAPTALALAIADLRNRGRAGIQP